MPSHGSSRLLVRRCRTAAAWAVCLAGVVAATTLGFQAVEAWARPVFEARLQERRESVAAPPLGQVVGSVALTDGTVVRQDLDSLRDGLRAIRVRVVTWGETPGPASWKWTLVRHTADGRSREIVRRGRCSVASAGDWELLALEFDPIVDSFSTRYTLRIKADDAGAGHPVGLPLYEPGPTTRHAACIVTAADGDPARSVTPPARATFQLEPVYADPEG
jgi:hypothetical protein